MRAYRIKRNGQTTFKQNGPVTLVSARFRASIGNGFRFYF